MLLLDVQKVFNYLITKIILNFLWRFVRGTRECWKEGNDFPSWNVNIIFIGVAYPPKYDQDTNT